MADWYEALKSWQDGKLSAEKAIRICQVADIYGLWELALGCGIDIKLGDREAMAGYIKGKRQIDAGERVDMDDVIAEIELIVAGIDDDAQYETIRERLRLKYLPLGEGFDADDIEKYERHLALSNSDRSLEVKAMGDEAAQLYIELEVARALYVPPVDREGGITEAKIARYPERYR